MQLTITIQTYEAEDETQRIQIKFAKNPIISQCAIELGQNPYSDTVGVLPANSFSEHLHVLEEFSKAVLLLTRYYNRFAVLPTFPLPKAPDRPQGEPNSDKAPDNITLRRSPFPQTNRHPQQ